MKKLIVALLCLVFMVSLAGCGFKENTDIPDTAAGREDSVNLDLLREKYPEYFEMSELDCAEVYVWQMAENSYRCGIICGADPENKDEQIAELQFKSLSIEEAKAILEEEGISKDCLTVYPITQPYSSYYYEIDDEYTERVKQLFE